jgi:hypothetical protein
MEVAQAGPPGAAEKSTRTGSPDAHDDPTWGEERIANELSLKVGIRVSPRTVGKYVRQSRTAGTLRPALGELCAESCVGHRGSRLFRFRERFVSPSVCIRCHGSRFAAHPPRQCDRAPHRRVDDSAVPRVYGVRSPISIRHPRSRCDFLCPPRFRVAGF